MATKLFGAIADDTVFFKYPENPAETWVMAGQLIGLGADQKFFVENTYNNQEVGFVKFLGHFLAKMEFDNEYSFVWAAVSYEEYQKYGRLKAVRETVASLFFQSIKGAKFGVVMLEMEKNRLHVSWRSKKDVDVSALAKRLGGGGHQRTAGSTVEGNFKEAVEKVLAVARSR